jgi:uncharacterized membrane protein
MGSNTELGTGPLAPFLPGRREAFEANGNGSKPADLRDVTDEQLARALGWFSIGLGLVEVLAPRVLSRLIGAGSLWPALPILGMREIISGVGILAQSRPAGFLWSRVAGDAIDLGFLAAAVGARDSDPVRLSAAAAAVAGVTALDVLTSERLSERPSAASGRARQQRGIYVRKAITVNRPIDNVYGAWRQVTDFPKWMRHLISVEDLGNGQSHWVAAGPADINVAWDAETTIDDPNYRIAWRSLDGSQVSTAGSVRFAPAPGNRGTELRIEMTYDPPGGQIGAVVASLFGSSAEQEIAEDLRRFKSIIETGEAPRTDGQPHGRCAGGFLRG